MFNKRILSLFIVIGLASCSHAENPVQLNDQLSAQEVQSLQWMVEEEKLASDIYQELYERWGLKTFFNIGAKSEVQHIKAVSSLLTAYGVENPSLSARGKFSNPDLQSLYNNLLAQGSQSLEQALYVGAAIEELDIRDLQDAINETQQADIIQVYQNLMKGSSQHLSAFMQQIERHGFSYPPQ